jgi:hypothetical protein
MSLLAGIGGFLEQYNTVKDEERAALAKAAEEKKKRTEGMTDWYTKQDYQEQQTIRAEKRAETTEIEKENRAKKAARIKAQETRSRVNKALFNEYDTSYNLYTQGKSTQFPVFSYDAAQDVPKINYIDLKGAGFNLEESDVQAARMQETLGNRFKVVSEPTGDGNAFLPKVYKLDKEDTGPQLDENGLPLNSRWLIADELGDPDLIKKEMPNYDMVSLDGTPLGGGVEQRDRKRSNAGSYLVYRQYSPSSKGGERARDILKDTFTRFTPEVLKSLYENRNTTYGAAQNNKVVQHFRRVIADFKAETAQPLNDRIVFKNIAKEYGQDFGKLIGANPELDKVFAEKVKPNLRNVDPMVRSKMFTDAPIEVLENGETAARLYPMLTGEGSPFRAETTPDDDGTPRYKTADNFKSELKTIEYITEITPVNYMSALENAVKPGQKTPNIKNSHEIHKGVLENRQLLQGAGTLIRPVKDSDGSVTGSKFSMSGMDPDLRNDIVSNISKASSHQRRMILMQASLPETSLTNADILLKDQTAEGMYEALGKGGVTQFNRMKSQGDAGTELYKNIGLLEKVLAAGGQQGVANTLLDLERSVRYAVTQVANYVGADIGADYQKRVEDYLNDEVSKATAAEDQQARLNGLVGVLSQTIVYQKAKMDDEDGRLSVDDIQRVEKATGLGGLLQDPTRSTTILRSMKVDAEYKMVLRDGYTSLNPKRAIATRVYEELMGQAGSSNEILALLGVAPPSNTTTTSGGPAASTASKKLIEFQERRKKAQETSNSNVTALEKEVTDQSVNQYIMD